MLVSSNLTAARTAAIVEASGRDSQLQAFHRHVVDYELLQAKDENGKLLFDTVKNEKGESVKVPRLVQAVDEKGEPITDEDGNPEWAKDMTKPITVSAFIRYLGESGSFAYPLDKLRKWAAEAAVTAGVTPWTEQKKKNADRALAEPEVNAALCDAIKAIKLSDGRQFKAIVTGAGREDNPYMVSITKVVPSTRKKKQKQITAKPKSK